MAQRKTTQQTPDGGTTPDGGPHAPTEPIEPAFVAKADDQSFGRSFSVLKGRLGERRFLMRTVGSAVAAALTLYAFWPALVMIAEQWDRRPEYSHGWIVPLFAVFILGRRAFPRPEADMETVAVESPSSNKAAAALLGVGIAAWLLPWLAGMTGGAGWLSPVGVVQGLGIALTVFGVSAYVASLLHGVHLRPSWAGAALLVAATAVRLWAADVYVEWIDWLTIVPFVMALALAFGGWRCLRWSWISAAFLFFMIPLPFRLETALREPLRGIGTAASTFAMQTLGLPAFAEGNVVTVGDVGIDVVEACSGLRMLMVFAALSVGFALLVDRPWWQKVVIVVSAVPIAVIANVTRITITGLMYVWGYEEFAERFFHDLAGLLMPLMAVAMLCGLLWYLDRLVIVRKKEPMAFGLSGGMAPTP